MYNNPFSLFSMSFMRFLHESQNHTNRKGDIRLDMIQISQATDKLTIESGINKRRFTIIY